MKIQIYLLKYFSKNSCVRVESSVKYWQKSSQSSFRYSSYNFTNFSLRSSLSSWILEWDTHACNQLSLGKEEKIYSIEGRKNLFNFSIVCKGKISFIAWITWMIMKTTSNISKSKMICFWSFFFSSLYMQFPLIFTCLFPAHAIFPKNVWNVDMDRFSILGQSILCVIT